MMTVYLFASPIWRRLVFVFYSLGCPIVPSPSKQKFLHILCPNVTVSIKRHVLHNLAGYNSRENKCTYESLNSFVSLSVSVKWQQKS